MLTVSRVKSKLVIWEEKLVVVGSQADVEIKKKKP
jgi:hypothetical protein